MEKICSVDDCKNAAYRRGYCNTHYLRLKRHGDVNHITRKSPGTATPEDKLRQKREEYQRHKDQYIARANKWAAANPDKKSEYLSRDEVKAASRQRTKAWSAANKNKKREYDKAWVENNRALANSYKAHRRAKERKATPPWLTPDQRAETAKIYAEALELTERLSIRHEVDHIVPLSGRTVSGLHVPWNLRAIPAQENNQRPRIWVTQYGPPYSGIIRP